MAAEVQKAVILGIGGGAGKIIQTISTDKNGDWASLAYLDTDVQDLEFHKGVLHVPLGSEWTQGMGCGGDVTLGENATAASASRIKEVIAGSDLVVVLACLGGGTASGGVQALARLLRDQKKLAFFFVTLPFAYEGNSRRAIADQAATALRGTAEVVVTVPNDLLFTHFPAHTGVAEAFELANGVMADGLLGVAELIRCRGILPIDFASLRTLLREKHATCSFGVGRGQGESRVQAAIDDLFDSPLLGGKEFVQGADVIVATLVGGSDLSIGEMNDCLRALQQHLGSSSRVLTGANQDPALGEAIQLTVLCVHYQGPRPRPSTATSRHQNPAATAKHPPPNHRGGSLDRNDTTRQFKLPFEEERFLVGIFGNTNPTMYNGENLDIPTFQRRRVQIDADARDA